MSTRRRDAFAGLTKTILKHYRSVFALSALMVVAALFALPGIRVTTSRTALVSPDDPYQTRLVQFYEDFGYPDSFVFLVEGGKAESRKKMVETLGKKLEADPDFSGKVLYRITPESIKDILLLQRPEEFASLVSRLPPMSESSLEEVLESVPEQLRRQMSKAQNMEAAKENLKLLERAVTAGLAYIEGNDPWAHMLGDAQENEIFAIDDNGYLVGKKLGHHLLIVMGQLPSDEVSDALPVVQKLRAIREEARAEHPELAHLQLPMTGLPALAVEEQREVQEAIVDTSVAAGALIFILFYIAFRSLAQTLASFLPLAIGTLASLTFVRFTYGELNLVTSSFISVLMGLGIDFAVHFIARFNELRRGGMDPEAALLAASVRAGPGILTGALTTTTAFLTIAPSEFTAFGQMGVITAFGMVLMLISTFVLLPPALMRFGHEPPATRVAAVFHFDLVPKILKKSALLIVIFSGLAGAYGGMHLSDINFHSRYFDFLPRSNEVAGALDTLEADGGLTPVFANATANSIEEARVLAEKLRALDEVSDVETVTDMLPPLDPKTFEHLSLLNERFSNAVPKVSAEGIDLERATQSLLRLSQTLAQLGVSFRFMGGPANEAARAADAVGKLATAINIDDTSQKRTQRLVKVLFSALDDAHQSLDDILQRGHYTPDDIPPMFRKRFVSKSGNKIALFIYPAVNIWKLEEAEKFARAVEAISPDVSGLALNAYEHPRKIAESFRRAALWSAILVFILLLFDFRRLSDALLALLPVTLGWGWMIAWMHLANWSFNLASIVALPLVLGIGIDTGVHIVHRARESARQNGGRGKLKEIIDGTGAAVVLAAFTTMAGFAGLLLSDFGATHSLGQLMILGISCCLVTSLIALPAVMVLTRRVE